MLLVPLLHVDVVRGLLGTVISICPFISLRAEGWFHPLDLPPSKIQALDELASSIMGCRLWSRWSKDVGRQGSLCKSDIFWPNKRYRLYPKDLTYNVCGETKS